MTHFSSIERTVILLAAHPREWEIPEAGLIRLSRRWLGPPEANSLANPRLEALRRLSAYIHQRRGLEIPTEGVRRYLEHGWRLEDIAHVLDVATRGTAPESARRPVGKLSHSSLRVRTRRLMDRAGSAVLSLGAVSRPISMAASLMALLMLAGCGEAQSDPTAVAAIPVRIATAALASASDSITGAGTAAYERQSTLSFRVGGVISYLGVDVGSRVEAGQPLARIAGTDLREALASRSAELTRASRTLDRLEALTEAGSVAVASAQDQRDSVTQARAAMAAAQYDQRSTTLKSPYSAVVLERLSQLGETISSGQAVLRVADLNSPLIVRVPLPARDADRIAIGMPAEVRFDAHSPIRAKVVRTQPLVSGATGTRTVEVQLQSRADAQSGAIASVRFSPSRELPRPSLVTIPAEAFVPRAGQQGGVFTVTADGHARFVAVQLVRFEGDNALVAGLLQGSRVVTAGAGYLKNGDAVLVASRD